jgi:predicted site-specific integrase-resolvase
MDPDPFVTLACAARRLGVCVRTLRRWRQTGKLPVVRYPSGRYHVSARVIAHIKSGQTWTERDTAV